MREAITLAMLVLYLIWNPIYGQNSQGSNAQSSITAHKLYSTAPIMELSDNPSQQEIIRRRKPGYHQKGDWILHQAINIDALPLAGMSDPALQTKYPESNIAISKSLRQNYDGIANTNVDPADPCIAVGPDHVVQMINAASGARIRVWDKQGGILLNGLQLDAITGISGKGDPIVLYDHFVDRWLLSEFSVSGNKLVVAISQTANPIGAYDVYAFTAPEFPDYPKYAIWHDAYIITTNESTQKVYAIDRESMLLGRSNVQIQEFSLPSFPGIGFQSATPVSLDGPRMPAQPDAPGMIMRMADDAWSTDVANDRLEIYELHLDWSDPSASYISNAIELATEPFDTELCGYTGFSCIEQPDGGVPLDPLRELLMYRIGYRHFGDYAAIVCNHVVDVDGTDHAGIRWYELRDYGSGWQIYQQGTYAPDTDHRWMGSIGMNEDGSIALAYNVSGPNTYPSIRYTGRNSCDPLGQMSQAETTIVHGASANSSNRYGDYNVLVADPADDSFWFTAMYNNDDDWQTRVAQFDIQNQCPEFTLTTVTPELMLCAGSHSSADIDLQYFGGFSEDVHFSIHGAYPQLNAVVAGATMLSIDGNVQIGLAPEATLPQGMYTFKVVGSSASMTRTLCMRVQIMSDDSDDISAIYPADYAAGLDNQPSLNWSDQLNATSYTVEISATQDFAQIIESGQTFRSDYQMSSILSNGAHYFWRVSANNLCGAVIQSDTFTFSTNSCEAYTAADLPVAISSAGTPTVSSTIYVPAEGLITDINISTLQIEHSWINDLTITLTSPSGTTVDLIKNICDSEDDLSLGLDDAMLAHSSIPCPPVSGQFYRPISPLSLFNGESMQGNWTLTLSDRSNLDGGQLSGWSLELCSALDVPCRISEVEVVTYCDDLSTPDLLDDRFSFDLEIFGASLSDEVVISYLGRSDTVSTAGPIHFDDYSLGYLISNGPIAMTITDMTDSSCSYSLVVEPPASCSIPLAPCGNVSYYFDGMDHNMSTADEIAYRAESHTVIEDSNIQANQDILFTAGEYILIGAGSEIGVLADPSSVSLAIEDCE